ncbi:hypothetical protein F4810DRAFT_153040 [Camillea tinctor]|nr:hypothetical protein F4810DRAFT_153040 [Camillea tinctor]
MNWTEGNLSRHSRSSRRNQLVSRQKQHFAKARNRALNRHARQDPVSISFLEQHHISSWDRRSSPVSSRLSQTSSPLLLRKQKHAGESNDCGDAPSSVNQDKRRRLLDQSDWAGLSFQQPIEISFPDETHDISHSRWSRGGHTQSRPAVKLGDRVKDVGNRQSKSTRCIRKRPLKIQIGSQEIQPSTATSSSPRSIKRYSLPPKPLASKAQTGADQISSPIPSQARQLYITPDDNKPSRRSKNRPTIQTKAYNTSSIYGTTTAVRPETPADIIYSSSTIHHPIPRRADRFTVLQWSPARSVDRRSLNVEAESPVESALAKANRQSFQDWIANISDSVSHNTGHDSSSAAVMLLPDSDAPLPSHLQVKLPAFEIPSEEVDVGDNNLSPEQTPVGGNRPPWVSDNYEKSLLLTKQASQGNPKSTNDNNDDWIKFIFDDDYNNEFETDVFRQAAHQAAVELLPSNNSCTSTEGLQTVATCGTDPSMTSSEQNDKLHPLSSCNDQEAIQGTDIIDAGVSNMATTGSSSTREEAEHRFRFSHPKTFIGKFAEESTSATTSLSTLNTTEPVKRQKGRWRRKKKALDGRADIRALPDFYGDPIEEFEGD